MSSTIRNKRAVILFECHTDYMAVFPTHKDDDQKFGAWVKKEMESAHDLCVVRGVPRPYIHIFPALMSQKEYDVLEVEEFLVNAYLRRKSGDA